MCLDRKPTRDQIIRDFKKKIQVEKGSYVGYKIFQKYNKMFYSPIMGSGPYKLNEWIIDNNKATVDYTETDSEYRCGFHVFIDEKEAKRVLGCYKELNNGGMPGRCTLRKVFFNKIIAYGYENIVHLVSGNDKLPDVRTIVTREMFIPKMR